MQDGKGGKEEICWSGGDGESGEERRLHTWCVCQMKEMSGNINAHVYKVSGDIPAQQKKIIKTNKHKKQTKLALY